MKLVRSLTEVVAGKTVALVGNSKNILREKPGKHIDAAEVVIRINLGLPSRIDPRAIGERTTLWAAAKCWGVPPPADCLGVMWMKLTALGRRDLARMLAIRGETPIYVWPQEFEEECRKFVGADPGTGIRILWWLKTKATPQSVSCYGMDCWEAPTHWSGRMNTPNHVPSLEREAMLKLL